MTINEAAKRGIRRVREPAWNDRAYLDLPLLPDGGHGPWVTLYDPYCQAEGIPVLWDQLSGDDSYEEYTGPDHSAPDARTGMPFQYPEDLPIVKG